MSSTTIHVMKFTPPTLYNNMLHRILLTNQIKKDTGWIINYKNVDYIIGNVWSTSTRSFEPGPGANVIVPGIITQGDIDIANKAPRKDNTSGLIFILGPKNKYDYNKNNWYGTDIENTINFDRFTIPYSLSPPPLRSTLLSNTNELHPNDKKIYNTITQNRKKEKQFQTKILNKNDLSATQTPHDKYKMFETEIANDKNQFQTKTTISTHTNINTANKYAQTSYKKYIPPPLRSKSISDIKTTPHDKKSQIHSTKINTETNSNGITHSNIKNINTHSNVTHTAPYTSETVTNDNTNISKTISNENKEHGALTTSKASPNNTKNNKNITYKKINSLQINNTSLAQNRKYKRMNSLLKLDTTTLNPSLQHQGGTKLNIKSHATLNDDKNTSIVSIPNDKKLIKNFAEKYYSSSSPTRKKLNSLLQLTKMTLKPSLQHPNSTKLNRKSHQKSNNNKNASIISHPNNKKLIEKFGKKFYISHPNNEKSIEKSGKKFCNSPSPIQRRLKKQLVNDKNNEILNGVLQTIPNQILTQNQYVLNSKNQTMINARMILIIYVMLSIININGINMK